MAEDIAARELRHPGHPELTEHVLSAAAKFIGSMWRFVKPKGKRKAIDACIALAMGSHVLASRPPPGNPSTPRPI